jgi:hypothetical protein
MKRVVLLPLHPAVTFGGVVRMTQSDALRGLMYSTREKSAMKVSSAALELLTHSKFKSQMTQLPCHHLQVISNMRCCTLGSTCTCLAVRRLICFVWRRPGPATL